MLEDLFSPIGNLHLKHRHGFRARSFSLPPDSTSKLSQQTRPKNNNSFIHLMVARPSPRALESAEPPGMEMTIFIPGSGVEPIN